MLVQVIVKEAHLLSGKCVCEVSHAFHLGDPGSMPTPAHASLVVSLLEDEFPVRILVSVHSLRQHQNWKYSNKN